MESSQSNAHSTADMARPAVHGVPQSQTHWPSIWQFTLGALAIVNLWGAAILLVFMGLVGLAMQELNISDPLPMFMMATAMFISGALTLPSAIYALLRVLGKQLGSLPAALRPLSYILQPGAWVIAFPLVLALGYLVVTFTPLNWLLLPPLHILAVGLPVALLSYMTVRALPLGSAQRKWGVFSSGLVLAPTLVLVLEGAAMVAFALLGGLALANQPELVSELYSLSEWLVYSEPSQEMILELLAPYLFQPAVILAVLAFGSVVVPLIEELLKPIGVWLLVGSNMRPAAGFAAGALSGAGYALFESLALTSSGEDWVFMVVARIGTAVIHILTTGLTGWALALAWQRGRYPLLGVAYLGAVFIHGLWNALTLFFSFATLAKMQNLAVELPPVFAKASVAPFVLAFMALAGFLALLSINRKLAGPSQVKTQADVLIEQVADTPDSAGDESVL
ncbi:MAG: PrsW family intramembrane metalloprotease [Anaerolineales bacterium]|nr:PrsW family intramembrane metalloprotease [Anaerolineales bacterium]